VHRQPLHRHTPSQQDLLFQGVRSGWQFVHAQLTARNPVVPRVPDSDSTPAGVFTRSRSRCGGQERVMPFASQLLCASTSTSASMLLLLLQLLLLLLLLLPLLLLLLVPLLLLPFRFCYRCCQYCSSLSLILVADSVFFFLCDAEGFIIVFSIIPSIFFDAGPNAFLICSEPKSFLKPFWARPLRILLLPRTTASFRSRSFIQKTRVS
jgi:hypothetical protein